MPQAATNPLNVTEAPVEPIEFEKIALRSAPPPATPPAKPELPRPTEALRKPIDVPKPKDRLPPPVAAPEPRAAETDVLIDRAAFPTRSMLPEAIVLGSVVTVWLFGVIPFLPAALQCMEVYASIPGACGLYLFVKVLFGIMGGGYRMTKTQILRVIPGPIPDPPPIDLRQIAGVTVEQTWSEWFLAIGRLKLTFERDSQPELVLGPIGWPRRRCQMMEKTIQSARDGTVTAHRATI